MENVIKAKLAGNNPVVIGIPVDSAFENLRSPYLVTTSGVLLGNHAVMGVKYDAKGVWIENQ